MIYHLKENQNKNSNWHNIGGPQTLSLIKLRTFSRIISSVLGSSTLPTCLNKAVNEAASTTKSIQPEMKPQKQNAKDCNTYVHSDKILNERTLKIGLLIITILMCLEYTTLLLLNQLTQIMSLTSLFLFLFRELRIKKFK